MSLFVALQASLKKLTDLAETNAKDLADTKSTLSTVQTQLAALQASGGLNAADAAELQAIQDGIEAEVTKLIAT